VKINFVVSVYSKIWIKGSKSLFATDPFIHHFLEKEDKLKAYDEVIVLPSPRSTKEELIIDHVFVDKKYQKYATILAERLNKIHGTAYEVLFWQKCLSLSIIRNITFIYDMFQRCEGVFDPKIHDCKILSEISFYTPIDFNDHRNFFQSTAFGQEQMFSVYINRFFSNYSKTVEEHFVWPIVPNSKSANKIAFYLGKISRITISKLLLKLVSIFKKIKKPRIVILDSYFSTNNLLNLIINSRGRIQKLDVVPKFESSQNLDIIKREMLSIENQEFDRFDCFFFSSLKFCFPRIFIEDFSNIYNYYHDNFNKLQKLEYVVNESWIGNNYSAIAVAILQKKGIKHICNEHNYLSHHFLCNNNKYIIPLTDKYLTLGWFKEGYKNLVKGGSLFEWVLEKDFKKEHDILFINGPPVVKVPEISAAYGHFGGFNAAFQIEFNNLFFNTLSKKTLSSCVFRGYPIKSFAISYLEPQMMMYDPEYLFKDYLQYFKIIDYSNVSAKQLMKKSRLIIVDYLSTSYIESMKANIPTIFFWNELAYPLEPEFKDFYSSLISVGICQTNPIEAGIFIEEIKNNPEQWWNQDSVQTAKNSFLENNFGVNSELQNYLTSLPVNI
jgi:putative transferase (TIGR04331 family)